MLYDIKSTIQELHTEGMFMNDVFFFGFEQIVVIQYFDVHVKTFSSVDVTL